MTFARVAGEKRYDFGLAAAGFAELDAGVVGAAAGLA